MDEPVLTTLDVGHRRLPAVEAVEEVQRWVARLRRKSGPAVLKVVHGRGRGAEGGPVRREVREWLEGARGIVAVIPGERYGIFDPATAEMRTACGHFDDSDLGRENGGITLVWVR